MIFRVVALNTLIGYVQESRAEAALDALRAMTRTQVTAVRDGRARKLASEDLVPGIWWWWRPATRCRRICA